MEGSGPGRRDRIFDDSDDTSKQRYEVSKEEAGDGGVVQPVGGCCLGEELEGDCPHDLSAVEDGSLQEWLRNKEVSRNSERDRGLDKSGNGRRLQT